MSRALKIKVFIVTYRNEHLLKMCVESVLTSEKKNQFEVYIINNFGRLDESEYPNCVVLNNECRPDFSKGHLARNWNQAIMHGFKNLDTPDADAVVCLQNDTLVCKDWVERVTDAVVNRGFDFLQQGVGDEFHLYTPNGVKRVGMWDERFCNIGYQEADYMLRAIIHLDGKASIDDAKHYRVWNPMQGDKIVLTTGADTGHSRSDPFHIESSIYHKHSIGVFIRKWRFDPENPADWKEYKIKNRTPSMKMDVMYPYFEFSIDRDHYY